MAALQFLWQRQLPGSRVYNRDQYLGGESICEEPIMSILPASSQ